MVPRKLNTRNLTYTTYCSMSELCIGRKISVDYTHSPGQSLWHSPTLWTASGIFGASVYRVRPYAIYNQRSGYCVSLDRFVPTKSVLVGILTCVVCLQGIEEEQISVSFRARWETERQKKLVPRWETGKTPGFPSSKIRLPSTIITGGHS